MPVEHLPNKALYKKEEDVICVQESFYTLCSCLNAFQSVTDLKRMFYHGWLMICWFDAFPPLSLDASGPQRRSGFDEQTGDDNMVHSQLAKCLLGAGGAPTRHRQL